MMEFERANALLTALAGHILSDQQPRPLRGYEVGADLINWDAKASLAALMQVCSRIDLAAFKAGLPCLALEWVRDADGCINEKAFPRDWQAYRGEIETMMCEYRWLARDFELIQAELDKMPRDQCARTLWAGMAKQLRRHGQQHVRATLHRRVRHICALFPDKHSAPIFCRRAIVLPQGRAGGANEGCAS